MHPFSVLTLGIFVAGYITARWDLVTRLYELAIFAWEYGVVVSTGSPSNKELQPNLNLNSQARAAKGFAILTIVFLLIFIPVERLATVEANLVRRSLLSRLLLQALANLFSLTKHPRSSVSGISAREQLRRRGSF
jgi:phosphatidylinositol glycan class Q protein